MKDAWLLKNIRKIILLGSVLWAFLLFVRLDLRGLTDSLLLLRLTQTYAFCALIFLYLSMLVSPLYAVFTKLPGKALAVKSRRALGVSSFFFALAHASLGFFGPLKGFAGLSYLTSSYANNLLLGLIALTILGLLTLTSFDFAVKKLGVQWFWLHRLVYIAGILILLHSAALGSHFLDLGGWIPLTIYSFTALLFVLEFLRVDIYMNKNTLPLARFRPGLITAILGAAIFAITLNPFSLNNESITKFSIHAGHGSSQNDTGLISRLDLGLRGKLGQLNMTYRAIQDSQESLVSGEPAKITFRIQNLTTQRFLDPHDSNISDNLFLFVIGYDGHDFSVIKADLLDSSATSVQQFTFTHTFASNQIYKMYLHYQPQNEVDQQFAFDKFVGAGADSSQVPKVSASSKSTITFSGDQTVTAFNQGKTKIAVTAGNQQLTTATEMIIMNENKEFAHIYKSPESGTKTAEFIPFAFKKPFISGSHILYLCNIKNMNVYEDCQTYQFELT